MRPSGRSGRLGVVLCSVSVGLVLLSGWTGAPGAGASPNRSERISFLAELSAAAPPRCLESWGRTAGITVSWRTGDAWATISGSAGTVGRAFGVTVSVRGSSWWASGSPRVPPAACGEIARLGALHSSVRPDLEHDGLPGGGLSPSQLLSAYDATPLRKLNLEGQGETVVVFEVDAYRSSDLSAFAADVGTPLTLSDPYGNLGKAEGESTMDIETVHEIAPLAHVVDVNLLSSKFSGSTGAVFADAFDVASRRWPGAIWSISLGICEQAPGIFNATDLSIMDEAVGRAEATGTSVFASSGDSGGLECMPPSDSGHPPAAGWEGVNVPAVLPSVTGVGGTSLSTSVSGQRVRETAWTETLLSQGSGGGVSSKFRVPTWQRSAVGPSASWREVPDVSADADPATGTAIVEGGRAAVGGGTSLATPIWAGFLALVDQYLRTQGKPAAGFLNPALYSLASGSAAPYPAFFDVTLGGNDFYSAGTGYDPVTGLGTPNVWNLARDLSAAAR